MFAEYSCTSNINTNYYNWLTDLNLINVTDTSYIMDYYNLFNKTSSYHHFLFKDHFDNATNVLHDECKKYLLKELSNIPNFNYEYKYIESPLNLTRQYIKYILPNTYTELLEWLETTSTNGNIMDYINEIITSAYIDLTFIKDKVVDIKYSIWQFIFNYECKYIDSYDWDLFFKNMLQTTINIYLLQNKLINYNELGQVFNEIKKYNSSRCMALYRDTTININNYTNLHEKTINNIPYNVFTIKSLKVLAKYWNIPKRNDLTKLDLFRVVRVFFKNEEYLGDTKRTIKYKEKALPSGYSNTINLIECDDWNQVYDYYKISFKYNNKKICFDLRDLLHDIESKLTTSTPIGIESQWPYFLNILEFDICKCDVGKIMFSYYFLNKIYTHPSYIKIQTSRIFLHKMKYPITHIFLSNLTYLYPYKNNINFSNHLDYNACFYHIFNNLLQNKYNIIQYEIQDKHTNQYEFVYKLPLIKYFKSEYTRYDLNNLNLLLDENSDEDEDEDNSNIILALLDYYIEGETETELTSYNYTYTYT